jgi:hypothetical protein
VSACHEKSEKSSRSASVRLERGVPDESERQLSGRCRGAISHPERAIAMASADGPSQSVPLALCDVQVAAEGGLRPKANELLPTICPGTRNSEP